VVSSMPRPHFFLGKDPVPILQEAGWATGLVWMGGKSRPHRDSIPDRPARSQSLHRLSFRAHVYICIYIYVYIYISCYTGCSATVCVILSRKSHNVVYAVNFVKLFVTQRVVRGIAYSSTLP